MIKEKAKKLFSKNKDKVILIGGIVICTALVALSYKKGMKDMALAIRDKMSFQFDNPVALKGLIKDASLLNALTTAYGSNDRMVSRITLWRF